MVIHVISTRFCPLGFGNVTPYFTVANAPRFLEFLRCAFDADLFLLNSDPNGTLHHARVMIGNSIIMVNESNHEYAGNVSQTYLYVGNTGVAISRALDCGATLIMPPNDREHGDRLSVVMDACGNIWWLATILVSKQEIAL